MLNGYAVGKSTFNWTVVLMVICHSISAQQANTGYGNQGGSQPSNPSQFDLPSLTVEQQNALQSASQAAFAQQNAGYDEEMMRQAEQAAMSQPQQPFADPSPEEAQYLDQFLDYWEHSSAQVRQYICEFRRFEYDSEAVNYRDPATNRLAAARVATGEIRFASPDKGYYETTQIWEFEAPPQTPGTDAKYTLMDENISKEKWICDGRHVYEFDFSQKRLNETEIPQEMQGAGIIESPIPFLFGAKKSQILERYWVRVIPKPEVNDEYWFEAYPKRIEDARLYSRIEVILDRQDFLPKAMHLYSPQYDPKKGNEQSRYFAFENRKVNDSLARVKDFFGYFVRPQTPITGGWKRVNLSELQDHQAALPAERK